MRFPHIKKKSKSSSKSLRQSQNMSLTLKYLGVFFNLTLDCLEVYTSNQLNIYLLVGRLIFPTVQGYLRLYMDRNVQKASKEYQGLFNM